MKVFLPFSLFKLIIILSLLVCCTIEKRKHLPGYNIQWDKTEESQKKNKLEKKNAENKEFNNGDGDTADHPSKNEKNTGVNLEPVVNDSAYKSFNANQIVTTKKEAANLGVNDTSDRHNDVIDTTRPSNHKKETKEPISGTKPETQNLAIASFILGCLAFLTIPILVVSIPCAILAIKFGSRSLHKIKSNPEKYKGKKLARAGVLLGITFFVAFIIAFIVILSNMSSSY